MSVYSHSGEVNMTDSWPTLEPRTLWLINKDFIHAHNVCVCIKERGKQNQSKTSLDYLNYNGELK